MVCQGLWHQGIARATAEDDSVLPLETHQCLWKCDMWTTEYILTFFRPRHPRLDGLTSWATSGTTYQWSTQNCSSLCMSSVHLVPWQICPLQTQGFQSNCLGWNNPPPLACNLVCLYLLVNSVNSSYSHQLASIVNRSTEAGSTPSMLTCCISRSLGNVRKAKLTMPYLCGFTWIHALQAKTADTEPRPDARRFGEMGGAGFKRGGTHKHTSTIEHQGHYDTIIHVFSIL